MKTTPSRSCVSCYSYDDSRKGTVATPCCERFVCGGCARKNTRLAETCILCQLPIPRDLSGPTGESLPDYEEYLPGYEPDSSIPPPPRDEKSRLSSIQSHEEKNNAQERDGGYKEIGVQHFIRKGDSMNSLSLAYRVSASEIRRVNHLFSDSLLPGRAFILIPGATRSLSASPDEEDVKKGKLKRFMVAVKCTDYDMAKTYMSECDYILADAVERYTADSQWTRAHVKDVQPAGPSQRR